MRGWRLPVLLAGLVVPAAGPTPMPAPAFGAARWDALRPGLELATIRVRAPGEGRWTRVVLLRADPARFRLGLETRLTPGYRSGAWTVDSASSEAAVAFNAGQFSGIVPWGWTVIEGREIRPPGVGPLSTALAADRDGRVRLVPADSIAAERARGDIVTAIQSYPTLLQGDGEIPLGLREAGHGVDPTHRDARLALCTLADGRLLLLLTRFDGLGRLGGSVPFGLTLGETASLLRDQGCRRAVALDGGISAQLLTRDAGGTPRAWRAWRRVPLGMVLLPRSPARGVAEKRALVR